MKQTDIIEVTLAVAALFDALKIDYYIGGSLASSAFGLARATMDVDLAAGIMAEHIPRIVDEFEKSFYIDREAVERAIREKSSFNMIHLDSMFKIDVFIPPDHPFERQVFARKSSRAVTEDGSKTLFFASREDIILRKLVWYQSGGRISERQWSDVLGVIMVQGDSIDQSYLAVWAGQLGVADLLEKAYQDSGIEKK